MNLHHPALHVRCTCDKHGPPATAMGWNADIWELGGSPGSCKPEKHCSLSVFLSFGGHSQLQAEKSKVYHRAWSQGGKDIGVSGADIYTTVKNLRVKIFSITAVMVRFIFIFMGTINRTITTIFFYILFYFLNFIQKGLEWANCSKKNNFYFFFLFEIHIISSQELYCTRKPKVLFISLVSHTGTQFNCFVVPLSAGALSVEEGVAHLAPLQGEHPMVLCCLELWGNAAEMHDFTQMWPLGSWASSPWQQGHVTVFQ